MKRPIAVFLAPAVLFVAGSICRSPDGQQPADVAQTDPSATVTTIPTEPPPSTATIPAEPTDERIIHCADGTPASAANWFNEAEFEPKATEDFIIFTTEVRELPADGTFYTGVDFRATNGPQTDPIPDFALGEGTTYGVSAGFRGNDILGVSAARAGENGELLPWQTAAQAEVTGGIITIEIPVGEIPGGVDKVRFTFSDGEICRLSGNFEVDLGFEEISTVPGYEPPPTLEEQEQICGLDACISLPVDSQWEEIAPNTGTILVENKSFTLSFFHLEFSLEQVTDLAVDSGYNPIDEGETHDSPFGTWQIFRLQIEDEGIYGFMAILEGTTEEKQETSIVYLVGHEAQSQADLAALTPFLAQTLDSFRGGS